MNSHLSKFSHLYFIFNSLSSNFTPLEFLTSLKTVNAPIFNVWRFQIFVFSVLIIFIILRWAKTIRCRWDSNPTSSWFPVRCSRHQEDVASSCTVSECFSPFFVYIKIIRARWLQTCLKKNEHHSWFLLLNFLLNFQFFPGTVEFKAMKKLTQQLKQAHISPVFITTPCL